MAAKLLATLENDSKCVVAYARQTVPADYSEMDKYVKHYFFPEDGAVLTEKDIDSVKNGSVRGLNGCAAYRRDVFDALGGFTNHIICDEDVVYASKALKAGYKVAYVSDAVVTDYTRLTDKELMKKAFDFGVCVLKNPDVFDYNAVKENNRKAEKFLVSHLKRKSFSGEAFELRHIYRAKRNGYKKALKYAKMSPNDLRKYTANPEYWCMDEILRDRKSVDGHSGYGRSDAEVQMMSQPPVKTFKRDDENL